MTKLRKEQTTWMRPDNNKPWVTRISHPTVWIWTDEDGVERVYSTKAEALEAMAP